MSVLPAMCILQNIVIQRKTRHVCLCFFALKELEREFKMILHVKSTVRPAVTNMADIKNLLEIFYCF